MEVVPSRSGGVPRLREVFSYDPNTDGFEPRTVDEIVSRSERLAGAVRFLGTPDIKTDIGRRVSILQRCVDTSARTSAEVFEITSGYYGVPAVR